MAGFFVVGCCEMPTFAEWFEIAKYIGAGATFVLGPVAVALWRAYQGEVTYSKTRDRETLTLLQTLSTRIDDDSKSNAQILTAITDLRDLVVEHLASHNENIPATRRSRGTNSGA